MLKIVHPGNAQILETTAEAFGALKYKGEFRAAVAARESESNSHPSLDEAGCRAGDERGDGVSGVILGPRR